MSDYYVLDACALIAFLNDEAGTDVVEELLRKSNHQEPKAARFSGDKFRKRKRK